MKKARHKKEKHVESQAQTTSAEQHENGSGDGVQPTVIDVEHTPVDSREGEIFCYPEMKEFPFSMINPRMNFSLVSSTTNLF